MRPESRIFVAGHRGMVGSALLRRLRAGGYHNLVLRSRQELDLLDQAAVNRFMLEERPEVVFIAAAKVGGIHANNTQRAQFIYENLVLQCNIVHAAWRAGVQRLLCLGSSCIYPRDCPQPIREEYLLSGPLEPTNEPYAVAKIAAIKLCESYNRQYGTRFIAALPCNLYGPGDNYDPLSSHVLPALIRKVHEASVSGAAGITLWGTGRALREFLYVDDMADACILLMREGVDDGVFNVGSGSDLSIRELAGIIMDVIGYTGGIGFDTGKPDGTPRKLLDLGRIRAHGWAPATPLREGIALAYRDFLERFG